MGLGNGVCAAGCVGVWCWRYPVKVALGVAGAGLCRLWCGFFYPTLGWCVLVRVECSDEKGFQPAGVRYLGQDMKMLELSSPANPS